MDTLRTFYNRWSNEAENILSASLFQDIAWLAFLSLAMATVATEIWPLLLRGPRRPLIKNILKIALRTFAYSFPVTLLDKILESKGYMTRLNGRFPTLTTILLLAQTFITPGFVIMAVLTSSWISTPKKMDEAAMNRILQTCQPPPDEMCVVCRGDFDKPAELPCRHVFCDGCIRLALREQGACPICRRQYA